MFFDGFVNHRIGSDTSNKLLAMLNRDDFVAVSFFSLIQAIAQPHGQPIEDTLNVSIGIRYDIQNTAVPPFRPPEKA
jgi:hypothetical protein